MPLSDAEIANIVFNETRSLSGDLISTARLNVAHAIINADASLKKLPIMASKSAKIPDAEREVYSDCVKIGQQARGNVMSGIDPTGGASHFNFRKNKWNGAFYGNKLKTSVGPLDNSYPTDDLPATGIYANTYE